MLRNRAVALILGLIASPLVIALGLGSLKSNSSLNEPFTGRIELLGATAQDFDALNIGLASREQFERAGISLNPLLFQLRFVVDQDARGNDFIAVTSKEPIREPFLNFLVELNWANGRLLREYTVLLDPPLYDANRRPAAPAMPAPAPAAAAPASIPSATAGAAPSARTTVAGSYNVADQIGPVTATDTLWSIASSARPDGSVTVQQMMLALLRENPNAFGEGNINLLRRGAILRMPAADSLQAVSASAAFAEVQRQHQLWEDYRNQVAGTPSSQPVGAAAPAAPVDATPSAPADSRLELVAPGGADGAGGPGSGAAGGPDLLREEIDARAQQNEELSGKLLEAEEIIDLLQRQVNIKDEELAALQARLAELGIEHGDIGATAEPAPAVDGDDGMLDDEPAGDDDDMMADDDDAADMDDDTAAMTDDDTTAADEGSARPPAPAAASRGFPHSLVPEQIANLVPGGALTVLGIIAVAILGLFAAVISFLMKARADDDADVQRRPAVAVAAPAADSASEDPTITAGTHVDVEDSEAITEFAAGDDSGSDFDPNATVEADGAQERTDFASTATDLPALTASAPADDEEDPLEEINVYLAYERFDQAEELVTRVIGEYPDRHEYKLRLLEVYYSSNDHAKYETAARNLLDAVGDNDPLWDSATAMWSEMSPERELFAEGGDAAPAPTHDEGKAFVDITGEAAAEEPGESTLAHAPGGEADLDFDLASGADDGVPDLTGGSGDDDAVVDLSADAAADDDVIDLGATAEDSDDILDLGATAEDSDDILDLTASAEDGDDVLDLTASAEDGDDVLDLTAAADDADDVLDLTAADDDGDVLDLTGGDDAVLDITDGGDVPGVASGSDDLLDVSGGGDDPLDLSDSSGDLLDVTKTGDISTVDDSDLLNVTSPGLRADELTAGGAAAPSEDAADLEITDITGSGDGALDFDISDTVAPAFDDAAAASDSDDDILDLTGGGSEGGDDLLDFDIGGLDDESEAEESDTLDLDQVAAPGAAASDADSMLEDELDFDITMGADGQTKGVDVVENEDEEGRLEITMSSPDAPPVDGDSGELEGDDFDFALEGTTEMDPIAADDTLDMGNVGTSSSDSALEDDATLDDLAKQLDSALDDPALDELEIEGVSIDDDGEHVQTLALDGDELPQIELDEEQTLIMPADDDVERQSDSDEADTKLNLAKAYIELGDNDGARSILDEVAGEGTDAQKAEAKALLSQLPG